MTTLTLAEVQRRFLAEMRGAADGTLIATLGGTGIPPEKGLSIYRHAYAARLQEALDNDHPTLGQYLGDDAWQQMCEGYLHAHPSRVRSLRRFGDALPAYLATAEPFRLHPEIAELAALERRLLDCFDAEDAPVAEWATLTALPEAAWPTLRRRFLPSTHIFETDWNTVDRWQALKQGGTPPSVDEMPGRWLLWRDDARVTRYRSLAADEALLLSHLLDGGDFSGGCTALLSIHPANAVPAIAINAMRRWCEEGLISRWTV